MSFHVVRNIFVAQQKVNTLCNENTPIGPILTQVFCVDTFPHMKGRPAKPADKKLSKRIPFVALIAEWEHYEVARESAGHKHLSEWIRATLNAEVARQQKGRKRKAD